MRKCLILFLFAIMVLPNGAAEQSIQKLDFDGETYFLAHADQTDNQSIEEFVRKKDNINKWEKLLSIRRFKAIRDARVLVKSFVDALKEQNAKAPYDVQVNKSTGEILFDFVVWAPDGSSAEFNVWKFKNTAEGVVGYQFAMKSPDSRSFLKNLPKIREALLEKMAKAEFLKE